MRTALPLKTKNGKLETIETNPKKQTNGEENDFLFSFFKTVYL